jgi:adenylate kinase
MNVVFVSQPAAGKGTHSSKLSKKHNLTHISTGNLLREEACRNGDIKQKLEKGMFIEDEIVVKLLMEKLKESKTGYVLDGFPRTIRQAEMFENYSKGTNQEIDYVIYLDLPKEESMKRIVGRRICNNCGSVFNTLIDEFKPKIDGVCDNCGNALVIRSDDNIDSFNNRYEVYEKETFPLVDFYNKRGLLYKVDSNKEPKLVFNNILNIIEK